MASTEVKEGSPLHQLVSEHRQNPVPDSRDWWQEVAQGLGVRVFDLNGEVARLTAENDHLRRSLADTSALYTEALAALTHLRKGQQDLIAQWRREARDRRHDAAAPIRIVVGEVRALTRCADELAALSGEE